MSISEEYDIDLYCRRYVAYIDNLLMGFIQVCHKYILVSLKGLHHAIYSVCIKWYHNSKRDINKNEKGSNI